MSNNQESEIKDIYIAEESIKHQLMEMICKESEDTYRAFFVTSRDSVFITSADGSFLDFNDALIKTLGYDSREELKTVNVSELYADPAERARFLRVILEQGAAKDYPASLRKKDGTIISVLINAVIRKDSTGRFIGYQGAIRDITEQKRAEKELRRRLDYEAAAASCMKVLMEPNDIDKQLNRVLHILREVSQVSRVYIFQNENDPEVGLCMTQIHEATAAGITPQIDACCLQRLPYRNASPYLLKVLQARRPYMRIVAEMDQSEQKYLVPQGIISILILPIYCGNEFWGYIGFDDCLVPRQWQKEDVSLLQIVADGIGVTLLRKKTEETLRQSEEKYRLLVTQMKQGVAVHEVICDEAGTVVDCRFLDVNESYERLTELKREKIIGRTMLEVLPKTKRCMIERYGQVAMNGETWQYECYYPETDQYYEVIAYSPRPRQCATIILDVTERKKIEKLLYEEKERFKTTLLSVSDGVISTDNQGRVVIFNKVAEQLTGWTQEEAIGQPLAEVFRTINGLTRAPNENPVDTVLACGNTIEISNHTLLVSKNGIERAIEESASPIKSNDNSINGVVLVFRDITEKKERQKKIEFLSFHDQLTGLYNRRFLEEELIRLDTERNLPLTLIIADVNGLKLANDAFGHSIGDKLLKRAVEIIKKECRVDDIIARIGGDEFVILLPQTNSEQAAKIVRRINSKISRENVNSIVLSIAFGWETKWDIQTDIASVFKKAEDNMYRQKLVESSSVRHRTLEVIVKALFEKNLRERQHSIRVSQLCEAIGTALALSNDDLHELRIAGLMHDIGKIIVDDRILEKPGNLNDLEWDEIRRHSETGYRIISSVNELSSLAKYVLAHHERWDGKGYPHGLVGEEIPLAARIIAIADAYDAMTSARPYRSALSREAAIEELKRNAGTQFDPDIVKVFAEIVSTERINSCSSEPKELIVRIVNDLTNS